MVLRPGSRRASSARHERDDGDFTLGARRGCVIAVDIDSGLSRLDALGSASLPRGARDKLAAYLDLLAKWNRTYNLTAIREPERMITHHLLDSLAVLPHLRESGARRLSL